jgi:chromosome segregation protein
MRIERIELIGFKSFSDKTVFSLHPGTTAIVGPNGCGKSNIVDAFKWVLGEQSAKSLRGGSMGDVIFSGSATKKTKGMAEVTLVLSDIISKPSNGSDQDKGEKEERTQISVTRRLYRSGESEYLMNKVQCRLKDIKNMFLDTGLELKAYSILEQGRIGDIVNSKPQDRRFLIEEVAGVMKYKVRKNEALSKLESSKSNLQRLQDIIAEVKRQINTIDRHAKKAERYKKLFDRIKDIELRTGRRDYKALHNEIAELTSAEVKLKSKEAEGSANVHAADALIQDKKQLCLEHEKSLGEIRSSLYALEREATEEEGKIALLKNDCSNLRERLVALATQDGELDRQKESATLSLDEVRVNEEEMGNELSTLDSFLKEKEVSFSAMESEILELDRDIENQRRNLFNKSEEISNTRNEVNHLSLNIESINRKAEKSSQDISLLNDSLSSIQVANEQAREEHARFESDLGETRKKKEDLAVQLKAKRAELTSKEETLYREREDLAAIASRLESLKEMDTGQMSFLDKDIKTICQVADIFNTPPEYETAIEAILGDKLRADIVEDQDEITKALQFIREQSEKRSGFISVNPFSRTYSESPFKDIAAKSGVIGGALQFVSAKDGYENVAKAILNDVVLVDSLKTALSLQGDMLADADRKTPYFVTLDGEVLEPSGMVFGGTDKGVLKIKRKIKEIEADISNKKSVISEAEKAVVVLKEMIVTTENEIISVDGEISSQEKYCHVLKVKMENLEEENLRLNKKHEYISIEITGDHKEKENLTAVLAEKQAGCKALEDEKLIVEERIKSVQNILYGKRESLEKMRTEVTEIKLNLASSREKMASVTREIARLNEALHEIDRKKVEIVNERERIETGISSREQEITEKESTLKSKVILVSELQSEASKVSEVLEAKTAELELMEKQQKELAAGLEQLRSELNRLEMKKMSLSMKLNYLHDDILKTYSVEISSEDLPDSVTPEEEETLPGLKEKLQAIGPVSLGTLDEYEELKTRFEFLTKQRDDLLESIKSLEETIQKINRTTKKRLEDAFEALNEKFKEVFSTLFGKGKAELQLTEGSILDAGIEIIAQPPGKRLQNLMLLSGGEKALTALSLLFAGFMIKPTPLCLLDEVDAPLDESNTDRFIKLLTEMAKGIQFITITHNRRTMEAADYIYGITMEEPGSSKTVSMHLAEAG